MSALGRTSFGPFLLAFYAVASTAGLLLIKSGLSNAAPLSAATALRALTSAKFVAGFLLYVISFVTWIVVLAMMPLSTAYPLAIGLTLALSTIGAAALLGEQLTAAQLLGIAFVFGAVLLLTLRNPR